MSQAVTNTYLGTYRFTCKNPLHNEAVAEAVMLASGKDLEHVMGMAAEAAKAAVGPAEADASAEVVAAAAAAVALVAEVAVLQHGSTPIAVESGGDGGMAETASHAQAKASAMALRPLLMV